MKKLNYIVSAIYHGIDKRVSNDTPYFNTLMLIYFIVFFHLVHVVIILKIYDINILYNFNKGQILTLILLLCVIVIFLLWKIFPKENVINIEVAEKDINKFYYGFLIYLLCSISFMILLLINLKQKLGI